MIKKTITYTDYDGNQRTEDFWFNLSKVELTEMDVTSPGGMTNFLQKIVSEQDNKKIWEAFKDLVFRAYGEKSLDGRRFIKDPEKTKAFSETEAYVELCMELFSDPDKAAEFVNGIVPQDVRARADQAAATPVIAPLA